MKKKLIIYLTGCVIGWLMGFNLVRGWAHNEWHQPLTYGDIAFVTVLAPLSWLNVVAVGAVLIVECDFWDNPIETKKELDNLK